MKRWMAAALTACWFGLAASAYAQPELARKPPMLPEPVPSPDTVPGPMNPFVAPQGPSDDPGMCGAFGDNCPITPHGMYLHVGALALQRQNPGHTVISLFDSTNRGLDTGNPPFFASPVAVDVNRIHPNFQWGVQATAGYLYDDRAIEVTGFYLPSESRAARRIDPGRLSSPFLNPPLGFEGDNGMFLQDDIVQTTLTTQLANAEVNYRWWNRAFWGIEGILGVRYFDLSESLDTFFGDDDILAKDIFGRPDPVRQATYHINSHSHLIAPQIGFEWNYPLLCFLTVGMDAKGAWGVNFVDINKRITRGDGFTGFNGSQSDTIFSSVYQLRAFLDLSLWDQVRVRFGYNALWFVHVPDAQSQVNYDFRNQFTHINDNGSIFYHGPMVELQLFF